ncbi:hypothetical protein NMS55_003358 [Vibrio cholerae]|nr:hypothetical protein [Vibrio cholerae]EJL6597309.1 hypothetical protein [Vibrio cholerae]
MTHFPRHRYLLSQRAYEHRVLEEAAEILEQRYVRGETFARTENTTEYLRCKLAGYEHEIFAHNHPSGDPEPSQADRRITQRLKDALSLVDIRVLDHVVVGKSSVSFAERGWL